MKMMKELMMAATAACVLGFASSTPASDPAEAEQVAQWEVTWQESKPASQPDLKKEFTTKTGFYLYNEDRFALAVLTCVYTPAVSNKQDVYYAPVIKRTSIVVDSYDRAGKAIHGEFDLTPLDSHIVYNGDNTVMPRISGVTKKGDVYFWLPDGDMSFDLANLLLQIDISQRLVKLDKKKDSPYVMDEPLTLSNSTVQLQLTSLKTFDALFEFLTRLWTSPVQAITSLGAMIAGSLELDMVSVSEKNVYVNRFKVDKPPEGQPLVGDNWFEVLEPESLHAKGKTTSLKFTASVNSTDTPGGSASVDHPNYMFQEKMTTRAENDSEGNQITTKKLAVLVYK